MTGNSVVPFFLERTWITTKKAQMIAYSRSPRWWRRRKLRRRVREKILQVTASPNLIAPNDASTQRARERIEGGCISEIPACLVVIRWQHLFVLENTPANY